MVGRAIWEVGAGPQKKAFYFKPSFTANKILNHNVFHLLGAVFELAESGGDLSYGL